MNSNLILEQNLRTSILYKYIVSKNEIADEGSFNLIILRIQAKKLLVYYMFIASSYYFQTC